MPGQRSVSEEVEPRILRDGKSIGVPTPSSVCCGYLVAGTFMRNRGAMVGARDRANCVLLSFFRRMVVRGQRFVARDYPADLVPGAKDQPLSSSGSLPETPRASSMNQCLSAGVRCTAPMPKRRIALG